jgi:Acetyltransferase (GNAT) family.
MVREVKEETMEEALDLVTRTFNESMAPSYSKEAADNFRNFIERIRQGEEKDVKMWFYNVGDEMAGVFALSEPDRISLCFVDKAFQGRKIATELFEAVKVILIARCVSMIKVDAFPETSDFYRKLGFRTLGKETEKNGMKYIPMGYVLM